MWRLSIDWAQFEDTNVCAVDWNILATNLYSIAAKNTKIVGKIISNFLIRLHRLGVPLDKMTVAGVKMVSCYLMFLFFFHFIMNLLIGHSMGGQIAGYVGDFMKHENYYLNRIFGKRKISQYLLDLLLLVSFKLIQNSMQCINLR